MSILIQKGPNKKLYKVCLFRRAFKEDGHV
jgi:hypothetical protein